jgi:hypothetical protein
MAFDAQEADRIASQKAARLADERKVQEAAAKQTQMEQEEAARQLAQATYAALADKKMETIEVAIRDTAARGGSKCSIGKELGMGGSPNYSEPSVEEIVFGKLDRNSAEYLARREVLRRIKEQGFHLEVESRFWSYSDSNEGYDHYLYALWGASVRAIEQKEAEAQQARDEEKELLSRLKSGRCYHCGRRIGWLQPKREFGAARYHEACYQEHEQQKKRKR